MSSVENLRKQAKRIVRWHRDRHYPVAQLIRNNLKEFAGMSDSDILAHRFQLTDAQELVARQLGFSSWQTLLEGANQMPDSQPQATAKIAFIRAEAQLLVTDIARSLSFLTETLGFETQFAYGEPPFYAQAARGRAYLNLRSVPESEPSLARKHDYLAATVCVDSIKELFLEYQGKAVDFHQTLRTEPRGARTFIVLDPDGNLILFAGQADMS
jgi:catechol 2,3-dioxygenase-like lactoylglutathione lyase family enzyme